MTGKIKLKCKNKLQIAMEKAVFEQQTKNRLQNITYKTEDWASRNPSNADGDPRKICRSCFTSGTFNLASCKVISKQYFLRTLPEYNLGG